MLNNLLNEFNFEINSIRNEYLKIITSIKEKNLFIHDSIKKRVDAYDAEEIYKDSCDEYCFLIDNNMLNNALRNSANITFLIITDFYLSVDAVNKIV